MKKLFILFALFAHVLTAQTVPNYVPANGLVGWWPLDGDGMDISGNNNHGILNGPVSSTNRYGQANSSLAFNGSNQDAVITNPFFNNGWNHYTISLWFATNNPSKSMQTLVNTVPHDGTGLGYNHENTPNVLSYSKNSNTNNHLWDILLTHSITDTNDANEITKDKWKHVVVVRDGLEYKYFIDGRLVQVSTITQSALNQFTGLRLGSIGGAEFLDGKLDDLGIWNRSLTSQEILEMYLGGNGAICPTPTVINASTEGLLGFWPFCGNANDFSANGRHATTSGARLTFGRNPGETAYLFDGWNDEIRIPHDPALNLSGSFTISAWYQTDSFPKYNTHHTLVSKRDENGGCCLPNTPYNFGINYTQNGINYRKPLAFFAANNSTTFAEASTRVNRNQWHNLTSRYHNDTLTMYLDGVKVHRQHVANSSRGLNTSDLIFGSVNRAFGDEYLRGKLDDVGIWNRALRFNEIRALATGCADTISSQPQSISANSGSSANFSASSSSPSANFQWQAKINGQFANLIDTGKISGTATSTILFTGVQSVNDNMLLRCVIDHGTCIDTSNIATLEVVSSIPDYVPTSGLVGWWPFNGNADDLSGNNNHGVMYGGSLTQDRFGYANQSALLDGVDDKILFNLNSINNTFSANTSSTSSLWIKTGDLNGPLISMHGTGLYEFNIGTLADIVQNSGHYGVLVRDGCCGTGNNIFGSSVIDNVWHMLTIVRRNNGVLELYKDGQLEFTSSSGNNGAITFNPISMSFGASQGWILGSQNGCQSCNSVDQQHLNGQIDDIAFWNRALTPIEIKRLYSGCLDYIILQPTHNTASTGSSAKFITSSTSLTGTYQWQARIGATFVNIQDTGKFSGTNNDTLSISQLNPNYNNYEFRCVINHGTCIDTSNIATLDVVSTIPDYVPTSGLVGWWPFNGNANDISNNANNADHNSALLTTDRNNIPNQAYLFGNAQYIRIPNSTTINSIQSGLTISAWTTIGNTQQPGRLLELRGGYGNGGDAGFVVLKNGGGPNLEVRWYTNNGSTDISLPTTPALTQMCSTCWVNLTYTADGPTAVGKLYFNGQLVATNSGLAGQGPISQCNYNNNPIYIGAENPNSAFWEGKIDDLAIWNRALTASEVKGIYAQCAYNISSNPENVTTNIGSSATFETSTNSTVATFQWQAKIGGVFTNLTNSTLYSGVTTNTITISNVSLSQNGLEVRCLVDLGCYSDTTSIAVLTISNTKSTVYTIGTSNLLSTKTGTLITPYKTYFMDGRVQYLILASEMSALNIPKGLISSVAFNVAVADPAAMGSFTIKMGGTNATSMSNAYLPNTTFATVYGPSTYTAFTGWNTHTFTTPFIWNGTDNVVIEVCFDNASYTYNSQVYYGTTAFQSVTDGFKDLPSSSGCTPGGITTINVHSNRPNIKLSVVGFACNLQNQDLPYHETFESPTSRANWSTSNPDGLTTWSYTDAVNGSGDTSAYLDFYNYEDVGARDGLISPPISLENESHAQLNFKYSYRPFDQSVNYSDSLALWISTNCGNTWTRIGSFKETNFTANGGYTFNTGNPYNSADFKPQSVGDWCGNTGFAACPSVDLTPWVGEVIRLKFEGINSYGQSLYLDDIRVESSPQASFTAGSSEACAGTSITFTNTSTGNADSYTWTVLDASGSISWGPSTFQSGTGSITTVIPFASSGTYSVKLEATNSIGTTHATQSVTINALPSAPTGLASPSFCDTINFYDLGNYNVSNVLWYNASTGGSAIAPWTPVTSGTTYYAGQTVSGCLSPRLAVTPLIQRISPPLATANQVKCGSNTISDLVATGSWIKWFSQATGGTALSTSTALVSGTAYYASQTVSGCESVERTAVTVTLSGPAAPTGTASQTFCNSGTVASLSLKGSGIQWYSGSSGGTPLASSTSLVNGTTYYGSQTISGCESLTRKAVSVTLNSPAAPSGSSTQSFCNLGKVSQLSATGTAIKWYSSSSGGQPLLGTDTLDKNTTYYASQSLSFCESATRLAVFVEVEEPLVTTMNHGRRCGPGVVQLGAQATDPTNTVHWYDISSGSTSLASGTSWTTPSLSSTTTYYAEAISVSGCVSRFRQPVIAAVTDTSEWISNGTGQWNSASNWTCGTPPTGNNSFSVASGIVELNTDLTLSAGNTLMVHYNSTLVIQPGKAIVIEDGATLLNQGQIIVDANATDYGQLFINGNYPIDLGTVKAKKYFNVQGNNVDPWVHISFPVAGALSQIGSVTPTNTYRWSPNSGQWVGMHADSIFRPGFGYTTFIGTNGIFSSNTGTVDATGIPFTNVTPSLGYHNGIGTGTSFVNGNNTGGWNLLGNPFTCNLDYLSVQSAISGLNNSFARWNPNKGGQGLGGFDVHSPASVGPQASVNIPPMSAVWVQTNSNSAPTTIASLNHKTHGRRNPRSFNKGSGVDKLVFTVSDLSNPANHDEMTLAMVTGASDHFDSSWDGRELLNSLGMPNLFYHLQGERISSKSVNFGLSHTQPKTIGMGISAAQNFKPFKIHLNTDWAQSGYQVFLKDKENNTVHNLTSSDYVFAHSTSFEDRFEIILTNEKTGALDLEEKTHTQINVWKDPNGLALYGLQTGAATITIHNAGGKLMGNYIANCTQGEICHLYDIEIPAGIYTITIVQEQRTHTTKLITINP